MFKKRYIAYWNNDSLLNTRLHVSGSNKKEIFEVAICKSKTFLFTFVKELEYKLNHRGEFLPKTMKQNALWQVTNGKLKRIENMTKVVKKSSKKATSIKPRVNIKNKSSKIKVIKKQASKQKNGSTTVPRTDIIQVFWPRQPTKRGSVIELLNSHKDTLITVDYICDEIYHDDDIEDKKIKQSLNMIISQIKKSINDNDLSYNIVRKKNDDGEKCVGLFVS